MGKILVSGANGQLGRAIKSVLKAEENYIYTDKSELDITDQQAVMDFVKKHKVSVLINCVAYTAVDAAEDDFENANLLNHLAVKGLAEVCEATATFLIHISTDYVFDGQKSNPYTESDTPNPQTIYGKTKLDGEKAIQKICKRFLILRTAWLYSEHGTNFVKTMLRLSREKSESKVVNDQFGTPTNAYDLATFIVNFIAKRHHKTANGIYHFSNEGICSWYDFAKEIMALANSYCTITPCSSKEYPTKAARPQYSVLDKTKLKTDFATTIPHWQDSLKRFMEKYSNQ